MDFDALVVGMGVEGSLLAAQRACSGQRVLHIGRVGERYGGQHSTSKGIDSLPLLLNPKGALSEQLIKLAASAYTTFVPVECVTVFTSKSGQPIKVPMKKEHVMLESAISLHDKRRLMSLMSSGLSDADPGASAEAFMAAMGLSGCVVEVVLFGVCMLPSRDCPLTVGELRRALLTYTDSLPQPWLYPVHGASEIAQSLVRVAAVHGAVQALDQPGGSLLVHDGRAVSISVADKVECDRPLHLCSHAHALSQHSLYGHPGLCMYVHAPTAQHPATLFILQLDSSCCCVKDGYLIHVWTFGDALEERIGRMFPTETHDLSFQYNTVWCTNKSIVY